LANKCIALSLPLFKNKNKMKQFVFALVLVIASLTTFAQGKTVYVSTEEIFGKIPQVRVADSIINIENNRLASLYDDRKTELNDLATLFIKDSVNMNASQKEIKRKSLQDKISALSGFEQELKAALEDYKEKQFAPIRKKVFDAIQAVAKAKAATTVLLRESALIFPPGSDITAEVIKKFGGK
jgi:outer membrane protein